MISTLLPSIPIATRINVVQPAARWLHRPRLADNDADVVVITDGMRAQCTNRAAGRRFSWCTSSSGCGEMGPRANGHCFIRRIWRHGPLVTWTPAFLKSAVVVESY